MYGKKQGFDARNLGVPEAHNLGWDSVGAGMFRWYTGHHRAPVYGLNLSPTLIITNLTTDTALIFPWTTTKSSGTGASSRYIALFLHTATAINFYFANQTTWATTYRIHQTWLEHPLRMEVKKRLGKSSNYPLVNSHITNNYGNSPFLMGKSTVSVAIGPFSMSQTVALPEGIHH